MSKQNFLTSKATKLMSRYFVKTGSIVLTRQAKLEALSASIDWLVKKNDNKPLRLTVETTAGDFLVYGDGKRLQLTWLISDYSAVREQRPASNDDHARADVPATEAETGQHSQATQMPKAHEADNKAVKKKGNDGSDVLENVVNSIVEQVMEYMRSGDDDEPRPLGDINTQPA